VERQAQIDIAEGGTVRVVLAGAVVMVRHEEILSQMELALKAGRGARVNVGLAQAEALDSSGVALLVLIRRLATSSGAEFSVQGVRPEIRRHLHMAGLTRMFGLQPPAGDDSTTGVADEAGGTTAGVLVLDEPFDLHVVGAIRERLSCYAATCAISPFDRYKLVLVATEIMANAVLHGGGRGTIQVERRDDRLLLRVTDHGPGIPRRHRGEAPRPRPGRVGSAGLWLARQICERVDIDTRPGRTTVLLTYVLPPPAE
jgi:anti-anti-sigma factor